MRFADSRRDELPVLLAKSQCWAWSLVCLLPLIAGVSHSAESTPLPAETWTELLNQAEFAGRPAQRHHAAAQLSMQLMLLHGNWEADTSLFDQKISPESFLRTVGSIESSSDRRAVAMANMAAHCVSRAPSGLWRRTPITSASDLDGRVVSIAIRTTDPVVRPALLVGLSCSPSEVARDTVVSSMTDADHAVASTACLLVGRAAALGIGPYGNYQAGATPDEVHEFATRVGELYRWDKTLGHGWGNVENGLRSRLIQDVESNDPVEVRLNLVVQNVSRGPIAVGDWSRRSYCLQLQGPGGYLTSCAMEATVRHRPKAPTMLEPGQTLTVWTAYVSENYALTKGRHRANWYAPGWKDGAEGAAPPTSNTLAFDVR